MVKSMVRFCLRWHRLLLWPAFFSLFLFVLSGFTHILMTWTGPQAVKSQPPHALFSADALTAIPAVLQQHGITQAAIAKVMPTERGNLLQVSTDETSPRRYFDLSSNTEIPDFDAQQAQWLARYYLDDNNTAVSTIEFKTAFDSSYPWVNRLLPVYRIAFDNAAHTTLTVHTETGALAEINNDWKRSLQNVFQQLHTFKWLEHFSWARIALMMLLLSCLLATVIAGASLLYAIPARNIPQQKRRWHRRLAHMVWIPLFGFTASGVFHLLFNEWYNELSASKHGIRLIAPITVAPHALTEMQHSALPAQPLNAISLLQVQNTRLLRASVAAETPPKNHAPQHEHDHEKRNARFDGVSKEQAAIYIDAITGQLADVSDEKIARLLAAQFMQTEESRIIHSEKVTRFGPGYDFRNKRLPVWRVDFNTKDNDTLFIDVASGVLVDSANNSSRAESYSFSFLHKWNFLTPLTGREWRDGLMVFALTLALALAALGILLRRPR